MNNFMALFFNKRLFREAGLDPNLPYDMQKAGTWTWSAFIDVCKKLTRDTNNDGRMDT
jgi:ABC-type glycerol-3-phosphate transport system substrate-binding protein